MEKLGQKNIKKLLKFYTVEKNQSKARLNWRDYLLPKKKAKRENISERVDEILYKT